MKSFRYFFKTLFMKRVPEKLQTDKGKEFDNSVVKNYLRSRGVVYFTTRNEEL